MYKPTLQEFRHLAASANLVPVYRELPADLETPVSVFLKLGQGQPAFLLESVIGGERLGRYSFLGTNPYMVLETRDDYYAIHRPEGTEEGYLDGQDPLHVLKRLLAEHTPAQVPGLPGFTGGAVGYLAYDVVRHFERLPECEHDELGLPDTVMLFADTVAIFDHVTRTLKLVANARVNGDPDIAYREATTRLEMMQDRLAEPLPTDPYPHPFSPQGFAPRICNLAGRRGSDVVAPVPETLAGSELTSNFSAQQFCDKVMRCKEYIAAGDAFQVVFSQRLRRRTSASPFSIYRALRMVNPSPYMFYLDFGTHQLIGSSIETLVKLEGRRAETHPIAGTRRRGATPEEDAALEQELLADPKERAEHIMLVDLGRNDLGRVCEYGTVRPTMLMGIERFSHVMHIVSVVEGLLKQGLDAFDLLRAAFPAGTVSGAPKVRAMEIINELEGTRRGPYAGAAGYFAFNGDMDTCISLRTIVMKGDTVYMQAGGGVVADSQPMAEYEESLNKSKALSRAVALAEELAAERMPQAV